MQNKKATLISHRSVGTANDPTFRTHRALLQSLRAFLCAVGLFNPGVLEAQDFTLDWFATASGGGNSSGGDFQLSATVGQSDAGDMSGGDFSVAGGFWSIVTVVETPVELSLTLSVAGGNVVISWPQNGSPGIVLEETSALANPTTIWTTVNSAPQSNNGSNSLQLPLASGNRFYRLHKP